MHINQTVKTDLIIFLSNILQGLAPFQCGCIEAEDTAVPPQPTVPTPQPTDTGRNDVPDIETDSSCPICGEGGQIVFEDEVINAQTCSDAAQLGLEGGIDETDCPSYQVRLRSYFFQSDPSSIFINFKLSNYHH